MVSFCLLFTEILYPKSKFKGTGGNLDISVNRDTCDKCNNEGCFIFSITVLNDYFPYKVSPVTSIQNGVIRNIFKKLQTN